MIFNAMTSTSILFAMSLGLIGSKLARDRFVPCNRIRKPGQVIRVD